MSRLPGWEKRFEEAVARAFLRTPPGWGTNDCCLFASTCCEAVTGIDPARQLRGTYSTKAEAEAIIAAAGGIAALVEAQFKLNGLPVERIDPRQAQRADFVEFTTGARRPDGTRETALGVAYVGGRIAALTEKLGIFLPIKRGIGAWRV